MSHFAKIENGVVVTVMVAEQEYIDNVDGTYVQTSYNTFGGIHYGQDGKPDGGLALRKNFAGIGMIYDADLDAFYEPQPYASWSLNEEKCVWESPVEYPENAFFHGSVEWNEDAVSWEKVYWPAPSDSEGNVFGSWTWNETTEMWTPPVEYPEDKSTPYTWNENSLSWVEIEFPETPDV
jgi:hypothetical protein